MKDRFSPHQFDSSCPLCPHGPMISIDGRKLRYVCSAFRRKGDCARDALEAASNDGGRWLVDKLLSVDPARRGYCSDCDCLFILSDSAITHAEHTCQLHITDQLLRMPSYLLRPLTDAKANAQYLFSLDSLNHIYSILQQLGVQLLVCVGTPRLHEFIQLQRSYKSQPMDSYLLDMDVRLRYFGDSQRFSRFNMINGFFFTEPDEFQFKRFCLEQHAQSTSLIFCDPPFAAPLTLLLNHLMTKLGSSLPRSRLFTNLKISAEDAPMPFPTMLVLPYFFDRKLQKIDPRFSLLDYKVTYANHARFDCGDVGLPNGGRRRNSVVRLFTNLNPSAVAPPVSLSDKYRFCEQCSRYSFVTNHHCSLCNRCPTRHGDTYSHCHRCGRCRPPNRVHCLHCDRCVLLGSCAHKRKSSRVLSSHTPSK
ncbi:unnamed protein product [Dicrocoelium dendriticum]|nr:unnamed protein product [Dicrocoelium dendriticum]